MSYTEEAVGCVEDFADGAMWQVTVGGTDVLVARVGEGFHAVYAYCSHYGAPLAEGALSEGRVVCPWHHACFELKSGRQLEPPGQDGLRRFDVRVDDGQVLVRVPSDFEAHPAAPMAKRSAPTGPGADEETFVILGGGAAGAYAAEALREEGFDGRIVMVTADHFLPYDRVNVSKDYLAGSIEEAEDLVLRSSAFYEAHDIEVKEGRRVTGVDAEARRLTFEGGETMVYDALILCTGGTPRTLDVDGAALDGIYTLRNIADSDVIQDAAQNVERVVIVGSSFIGMEGASSLRQLREDLPITVVSPSAVPFAAVLGEEVGRMLQVLHEENGIAFRLEEHVARFEGEGAVAEVVLESGERLPADLVVVGIGVEPATGFLKGVDLAEDGGVIVDDRLRAAEGLWAAGDIARFPDWRTGQPTRIEHWRLACQHGRLAGYNAAGRAEAFRSVPFFWSAQHGSSLRYVGHADSFDEVVIDGDLYAEEFIAYYVAEGEVRAAFGMGRDQKMAALEELMRREILPTPGELCRGEVDLLKRLNER